MIAIDCKFIPMTNHKPTRIKVFTKTGLKRIYSYEDCAEQFFKTNGYRTNRFTNVCMIAVEQFVREYNWAGLWVGSESSVGATFVNSSSPDVAVPEVFGT